MMDMNLKTASSIRERIREYLVVGTDPGITETVALLRAYTFNTTDSGDGVTKPANGDTEALTFPHVFIKVEPRSGRHSITPLQKSHDLVQLLLAFGIEMTVGGPVKVELSYDPLTPGYGILALMGLNDEMLVSTMEKALPG